MYIPKINSLCYFFYISGIGNTIDHPGVRFKSPSNMNISNILNIYGHITTKLDS